VLADNPVGYWRLGEASGTVAADAAGTSTGTYQGGVILGAIGALAADPNTAARFDGSDDKVSMGDPAGGALDFGTGDFTVELWAKTTTNGERATVSKRPSTGSYWQVTVTDDPGHAGEIRVNVSAAVTRELYGPTVRVDDGAWHHVVVAFDRDSGTTAYVDGVGRFAAGDTGGSVDNAGPFLVGKSTGYGYFAGDLDEVAVYPTLLSAARVQAHFTAGHG
jgi:Concanavalin A-like lectin/glucanases superfamily